MLIKLLSLAVMSSITFSVSPRIGDLVNAIAHDMAVESATLNDPLIRRAYEASSNDPNIYLNNRFAPYYFKNLNYGFGYNEFGSCGYVAAGMLLSFWDTYWDDDVVPEYYEEHASLYVNHALLDVDSPGNVREPNSFYQVDASTYHSNITTYKNTYFHFLLLDIGKTLFNTTAGDYGMTYSQYDTLFSQYIYNYRGYSTNDVEIVKFSSTNSESVRQKAIDYVSRGIPVKLGIDRHAVVAYDYDAQNDKLYCHFGWGANTTHVTIESLGYTSYNNVVAFDFKNTHSHSDNYEYVDAGVINGHCSCEVSIPYQIDGDFMYVDVEPTFSWLQYPCLCEEKWFEASNGYLSFRLLRNNKTDFYSCRLGSSKTITLNANALKAVADYRATGASSFYVEIALFETSSSSNPLYYFYRTCYFANSYTNYNNLFLELKDPRKSGTTWTVTVKNLTCVKVSAEYNNKMCNFNDAKNWTSLSNISTVTINPKSSVNIQVSENWFATSITISWQFGGKRYITYADHLNNASGTLTPYTNRI